MRLKVKVSKQGSRFFIVLLQLQSDFKINALEALVTSKVIQAIVVEVEKRVVAANAKEAEKGKAREAERATTKATTREAMGAQMWRLHLRML